jgi:hypothetical protein
MTESHVIRVKGTCAETGVKFDRYSVLNVLIKDKVHTVNYVHIPDSGTYLVSTNGLPDIRLVGAGPYWCAHNTSTKEALGASSLSTAFDFAVKHWWIGF